MKPGLAALIVALLTSTIALSLAGQPQAAADSWDIPRSIAVDDSGDVWVTLWTDTAEGLLRRFEPDGVVKDTINVGAGAGTVEEGPGGDIFVVVQPDQQIVRYADGVEVDRLDVPAMVDALGVSAIGRSLNPALYVLRQGREDKAISRLAADGSELETWQVDPSASGLAAGPFEGAPEGVVYEANHNVPIAGSGRVVRWLPDGTPLTDKDLGGEVGGMDVDAEGWLHVGANGELAIQGRLLRLGADLSAVDEACELPGRSVDLSVAPDGSVYIIVLMPMDDEFAVVRMTLDCVEMSRWDQPHLSGVAPRPTDTPGPGTSSATPTATATASSTPTATESSSPTASETPADGLTLTALVTPTTVTPMTVTPMTPDPATTEPPGAKWRAYLPSALVEDTIGEASP